MDALPLAKKMVLVVGHIQLTCKNLQLSLKHVLGKYIEVDSWCVGETTNIPTELQTADLVLAATKETYALCQNYCRPLGTPVILAERALSIQGLEQLFLLEKAERAYVYGMTENQTKNTIQLLDELKLGVEFIPYYANNQVPCRKDIDFIITPGLFNFIPEQFKTVIDIGPKDIALSSLAQIINILNIPITEINSVATYYLGNIFKNVSYINHVNSQNERLYNQRDVFLDILQEAIISIDSNGKIIVFNHESERIFNLVAENVIGTKINEVFPNGELSILVNCFTDGKAVESEICQIGGKHFIVNANVARNSDGSVRLALATLYPVHAISKMETRIRNELKSKKNLARHSFASIRGNSPAIQKAVRLAKRFAESDMTVLLEGETGTGKELFAQAIHNASPRRKNPFLAVNCSALQDNLIESELFGYEDGAFTGARKGGKIGLFEEAQGGTIFLDEIGSASRIVQDRLLRAIEEHEIRRVGGTHNIDVDVRIIAATNTSLEALVDKGIFRLDLFYRLCALPISIPPLRNRKEDIPILFKNFVKLISPELKITQSVMDFLIRYSWPGNIRELQNFANYICTISEAHKEIDLDDIPSYMIKNDKALPGGPKINTGDGISKEEEIMLRVISNYSNQFCGIGFTKLYRILKKELPNITQYYVKKWLARLAQQGLVESGVRRQGSKITDSGSRFLQNL